MATSFKCCGIRARLFLLTLLTLSSMTSVFMLSAHYIRESLYETRYDETRQRVRTARTLAQAEEDEGLRTGLPIEHRQQHVLASFAGLNQNNREYIFVVDNAGKMLLHPSQELQDQNVLELTDAKGKKLIKELISITQTKGEGSLDYLWPPGKEAGKKVTYATGFGPWGWNIASGVQLYDIDERVRAVEKNLGLASVLVAIFALSLAYLLGRRISAPIISLNEKMQEIAGGHLVGEIKETKCFGEIGSMAQTVQQFLENARRIQLLQEEQTDTEGLKSEFISVVSHELRTPLTAIRGSLGLIVGRNTDDIPERIKKLILIAYNNSTRLITLINDILDIDKIAAGNMRYDLNPESVNTMLGAAIDENKTYATKHYVRYELQALPKDKKIMVDSGRFQQVMANFLSNAAKYSPAGAKVDISAVEKEGAVRISVRDYGLGIPDEFVPRIFRKFSQADSTSTRRMSGTGLGLYISKQLVEQMNGRVGFTSQRGLGATFWVEFPVCIPSPDGAACLIAEEPAAVHGEAVDLPAGQLPVILHIEPNDDFCHYLAALFHQTATIVQSHNFEEAAALTQDLSAAGTWAAVITELNVRDVDKGPEFIAAMHAKHIPVIIFSTREPRADMAQGAYAVIMKSRAADKTIVQTAFKAIQSMRKGA